MRYLLAVIYMLTVAAVALLVIAQNPKAPRLTGSPLHICQTVHADHVEPIYDPKFNTCTLEYQP